MTTLDRCIELAPDPGNAARRLERLGEDSEIRRRLDSLDGRALRVLVAVLSVSDFLFHFVLRHPPTLDVLTRSTACEAPVPADAGSLRLFKYRELFRITCLDLGGETGHEQVLEALTGLAETILREVLKLSAVCGGAAWLEQELCVFGLGKLGAAELNYSSDVDLIFVSRNDGGGGIDIGEYQKRVIDALRRFNRMLETHTEEGFLYRVDLNLRPWGQSGPLFMAIDDTEHYYEASSDAWERFAWLRARPIAGSLALGGDLMRRLEPFVYRRSLSMQDLERFVEIKREMERARKRRGHWNIKLGDGGIRDIEFFVQVLQIVNASRHEGLRCTGTLEVLNGLRRAGLIPGDEEARARDSYLFLRRLENRLQMQDEQQTHELPEDPARRLVLARSLGLGDGSDDEILDRFETELYLHRSVARELFDRILPESGR